LNFLDSSSFDIGSYKTGQNILPINTYGNVSGGALPYRFYATGLPIGINIDPDTGIISGSPVYASLAQTARIYVYDLLGQVDWIDINVGQMINTLTVLQNSGFNIPRLAYDNHAGNPLYPTGSHEPTQHYDMIDPSLYVNGGVPYNSPYNTPPYGPYTMDFYGSPFVTLFNVISLPDTPGQIRDYRFTPTNVSASAGTYTVEAEDLIGDTATITASYDRIIPSLAIMPTNASSDPISPIAYWDSGVAKDIPITWVMAPMDLSEFVTGGIPPYTYKIPGLSPNFSLDTQTGILTSNIRSSQLAHTVNLEVTDSRGVTVYRAIDFKTVGDGLLSTYLDGWCGNTTRFDGTGPDPSLNAETMMHYDEATNTYVAGMDLPPVYLGMNGGSPMLMYQMGANRTNFFGETCNFASLVTGGTPFTSGTAYTWTATGLPSGYTLTANGELYGTFPSTGTPMPQGTTAVITATDNTPGSALHATIVIKVGPICPALTWVDRPEYDIPSLRAGTELVANNQINPVTGTGTNYAAGQTTPSNSVISITNVENSVTLEDTVYGGYIGYTNYYEYRVVSGTLDPYHIGEVNGRLSGGHNNTVGAYVEENVVLEVKDNFGRTAQITIKKGAVLPPVGWSNLDQAVPPLTVGLSYVPATARQPIVATNVGAGSAYALYPDTVYPDDCGLNYNVNGYWGGDSDYGYIPQYPMTGFNLIPYITVTDTTTGAVIHAPSNLVWSVPSVYPQLKYADGITSSPYVVVNLPLGTYYESPILIDNSGYPQVTYTIDQLPPGLKLDGAAVGSPYTTGYSAKIVGTATTAVTTPMLCTLTATRPANEFTPSESFSIQILFPAITGPLQYIRLPNNLAVPALGAGVTMTPINVSLGASGGDGNYTFSIVSTKQLPAGVVLNASTGIISGTPSVSTDASGSIEIRVTDGTGATASIIIPYGGVVPALNFTDSASYDIPAHLINEILTMINVAPGASGGVPPYTFSALNTAGVNTISPYSID